MPEVSLFKQEASVPESPDDLKKLTDKYLVPENFKSICVPKVNKEVWRSFKSKQQREPDLALQSVERCLSSTLVMVLKALELLKGKASQEDVKWVTKYMFKMLSHGLYTANRKRKMLITPGIPYKYRKVTDIDVPHTEYLFGDNLDSRVDEVEKEEKRAMKLSHDSFLERRKMVDANQKWEVQEAIDWMTKLAPYKPLWIEEPTNPDDVMGHAAIAEALNPLGIGVATGEHCQNRVMFKQFLKSKAMQYCQVDACRLGGVNECVAVILLAAKFKVPVCPHAGGVGLCELVQHLSMFDYISVGASLENRMTEYSDHLHEHMEAPVVIKNGHYEVPTVPGYLVGIKEESLKQFEYPSGTEWQRMFADGTFEQE